MCFASQAGVRFALLAGLLLGAAGVRADVEITQLGNSGALITDGEARIVIDAMVVEPYAIYAGLPPQAVEDFTRLTGPFADIALVLASHRHHDHNQPAFACDFMQKSSTSRLVTSAEVIGLMREKCRTFMTTSPRVESIDPQPGRPVVVQQGSARITVFRLSHGKRKYARIENFAHLIEMDGVRLLHIGDAVMDPQAFEDAGLAGLQADVAFIPAWFFQPGPGEAVVRAYLDAPLKIAVQVPLDEVAEARAFLAEKFAEVRLLDPLESIIVAAP
jgi:L-ascorbate metabolism protein UlaG (beta-lactamase superfamily)